MLKLYVIYNLPLTHTHTHTHTLTLTHILQRYDPDINYDSDQEELNNTRVSRSFPKGSEDPL